MRWRRHLNLLNLLLMVGIALLMLGIAQMWWGENGVPSLSRSLKGPDVPIVPILRDQQPLSAFAVVASKNLFSQDRSGPSLDVAKAQNSLEGRRLLGTMIIGDTRAALIGGNPPARGQAGAEVDVIYLGEEWGGFKVIEISNDSVVFQGKDGQRTLNFPE